MALCFHRPECSFQAPLPVHLGKLYNQSVYAEKNQPRGLNINPGPRQRIPGLEF